jgi:hypothetical protein
MAKKNKGRVVQMLSPENYIRTKARSLPIYECIINSDWEESKTVLLTIARKHTTGNITACYYMIDLMCLGVKETNYSFNISLSDYQLQKAKMHDELEIERIGYTLAHNIVYASLEYADEFGFTPHKDFTSVTRFMLEEDTEDIDMIDIECGSNGKPLYLRGPFDNDQRARQIINQLEKTAGPGKYTFIENEDDFPKDDFSNEESDFPENDILDKEDDIVDPAEFENNKNEFLTLFPRIKKIKNDEFKRLIDVTNLIFEELTDDDQYHKYSDEFIELLDIDLDEESLPDEIIGLDVSDITDMDELKKMFVEILTLIEIDKPKKALKFWEQYKKKAGDLPSVYYLELRLLQAKGSKTFKEKLIQYKQRFPNYTLIKFLFLIEQFTLAESIEKIPKEMFSFRYFFDKRKTIHQIEMTYFLTFTLILISFQKDASKLDAFHTIIKELDIPEDQKTLIVTGIISAKINSVAEYLYLNYETNN